MLTTGSINKTLFSYVKVLPNQDNIIFMVKVKYKLHFLAAYRDHISSIVDRYMYNNINGGSITGRDASDAHFEISSGTRSQTI